MTGARFILEAPAKINWTLDVGARRPDGYHDIASVMQTLSLADALTFERSSSGFSLTVDGPFAEHVPVNSSNLIWRAAQMLEVDDAAIKLTKNIPVQAGLGGGSSDAAATLLGLNSWLGLGRESNGLAQIGAALGADVAFFLHGGLARVNGIGERVTPLAHEHQVSGVIVKPLSGVSTKDAYAALDAIPNRAGEDKTAHWDGSAWSNDFESVIYDLYPEVAQARTALKSAGAGRTLLCGSGAAVFGSGANNHLLAERVHAETNWPVWVVETR